MHWSEDTDPLEGRCVPGTVPVVAPGRALVPLKSLSLTGPGTFAPQGTSNGHVFSGLQRGSQEIEAQELNRQEGQKLWVR